MSSRSRSILIPALILARRLLRGFAGIAPAAPSVFRERRAPINPLPIIQRWERRPPLSNGSLAWLYLSGVRGLPDPILTAARVADAVREGPRGSAWFAHRDATGVVTGIEMRGPTWRTFSAGGVKTLFRLPGGPPPPGSSPGQALPRLAICEAAIDALSLAALENLRRDTLYAATTGGLGPATIALLQQMLPELAADPAGSLVAATDADSAGQHYAVRLETLAREAGVPFTRLLPPHGVNDWNDALRVMPPAP
jgi:hypothetical protein